MRYPTSISAPDNQMRRISKVSVERMAVDEIREFVLSGRAVPGSRLTEQQLAETLGTSRGTVRTALQELSRDGLVRQVPYTGWHVAEFKVDDIWELYTLRASLEGLASSLAAERLRKASKAKIVSAFDGLRQACESNDQREIAGADFNLHKVIVEVSEHKRLLSIYALVEQQIRFAILSSNALIQQSETIIQQHEVIVEAILAKDQDKARYEAEQHNKTEGEKLIRHLSRTAA